jgi:flagellar motor switch protein FliG
VEESGIITVAKPPTAGKDIGLLRRLCDRDIQKTLRKLDGQTLMFALRNADKKTQDKVFNNMSAQAARDLKEDMEYVGKVPLFKVRSAQAEIAAVVDALAVKGEIEIIGEDYV